MKIYVLVDTRNKVNKNIGVFADMSECQEARKRWAKQLNTDEVFLKIEESNIEIIPDRKCKTKTK